MKLHLLSLEQDLEMNPESINVIDIPGQIEATRHLLSVATDIMNNSQSGEAMDSMERTRCEGVLDTLTVLYKLTYDLSFAIQEGKNE